MVGSTIPCKFPPSAPNGCSRKLPVLSSRATSPSVPTVVRRLGVKRRIASIVHVAMVRQRAMRRPQARMRLQSQNLASHNHSFGAVLRRCAGLDVNWMREPQIWRRPPAVPTAKARGKTAAAARR